MPIAPLFFHAEIYFIVFGVIMILGGIMGYLKANSIPSLVAGAISGVLLIVGALLIPKLSGWRTGALLELIVSLLLAGRFIPSLVRRKFNPAAYVVPLAIIGAVLAAMLLFSVGHP